VNLSFATILSSVVIAAIASGLIAFLGTSKTLRANQPKTEAEADQYQAQANRQNIETQSGVIEVLRAEIRRLNERTERQDVRIGGLEAKLDLADSRNDDLEEQNRILRRNVRDLEQRNLLLMESLRVYQSEHSINDHDG
jgi:predicted RNase H-like nuclease (RuvC/YqgF family)